MNAETLDTYWEYFDKFYCISIEERADRRAAAKVQFEKVGLAHKVEFVIVQKHPHNCEEGIYNSHMACIKKGLLAGADNIVIFEDDIVFDRFSPACLKDCVDFLSGTDHWSALFFGCLVSNSKKTENRSVLQIKYRYSWMRFQEDWVPCGSSKSIAVFCHFFLSINEEGELP